tara:strand:+ start:997 stop:1935 length:939 start_codon:yes stop_codon:yes gene_type:complete
MKLILGDCLIQLKTIPDKSVDFVYCDLSYGQTACKWDKKFTPEQFKIFWIELKRIARNERTPFFFSCTTKFGYDLIKSNEKYFRWDLVWKKKNRSTGFLNAYKLPLRAHEMIYCFAKKCPEYDVSSHSEFTEVKVNRKAPKATIYGVNKGTTSIYHKDKLPTSDITPPIDEHELVYCFAKKSPVYDVSSHKEYKQDNTIKNPKVIEIYNQKLHAPKRHKDKLPTSDITQLDDNPSSWCEFKLDSKTGHRTAKPIKLMEFLLKYWSKEGDTILDPTMGSGSMGIACKNMNREFIGIELNELIYELATKRINDA